MQTTRKHKPADPQRYIKQLMALRPKTPDELHKFVEKYDRIYVVEQNRDAQLRTLLILDAEADPKKLVPVLHYNGNPIYSDFIVEKALEEISKGQAA